MRKKKMTNEEIGNAIINESSNILGCIEGEIENKFKRYGGLRTNRGTKGTNLENAVKLLLQTYLGSRFDFYNKAQILDANLNYLRIFEGESS
jgi:hypothetical protein